MAEAGVRITVETLGARRIEEVIRLVTGEVPAPGTGEALHCRTGGDPRRVLVHILVTLCREAPLEQPDGLQVDSPDPPGQQRGTFRHEGDYWTLSYAGRTVRVRDSRGLHYIALLLRSPGCPVHVRDLVHGCASGRRIADAERARVAVTKGIKRVLERLRVRHRELAEHLGRTIRRGSYCTYVPGAEEGITWEV